MAQETLADTCRNYGKSIDGFVTHNDQPVDGGRLLWAIAGIESTHGRDREYVRLEQAYAPGGSYYAKDAELRELWKRYGVLAACSFGSFQVMFKTAYELGYRNNPLHLQDDDACAYIAQRLILKRFIEHQGAKTLKDVLDSYNSGNWHDRNIPAVYIRNGIMLYEAGFEHVAQ